MGSLEGARTARHTHQCFCLHLSAHHLDFCILAADEKSQCLEDEL